MNTHEITSCSIIFFIVLNNMRKQSFIYKAGLNLSIKYLRANVLVNPLGIIRVYMYIYIIYIKHVTQVIPISRYVVLKYSIPRYSRLFRGISCEKNGNVKSIFPEGKSKS